MTAATAIGTSAESHSTSWNEPVQSWNRERRSGAKAAEPMATEATTPQVEPMWVVPTRRGVMAASMERSALVAFLLVGTGAEVGDDAEVDALHGCAPGRERVS